MAEPIFDHEKLDVYRLSIEYVAASYNKSPRRSVERIVTSVINGFARRHRSR
jgi:hypothetical protein